MIAVKNTRGDLSKADDNLYIYLGGNHFQQNNRIIATINKVISKQDYKQDYTEIFTILL